MQVNNIISNNHNLLLNQLIKFFARYNVKYLLIKYPEYYEIHFNNRIFRIIYSNTFNIDFINKIDSIDILEDSLIKLINNYNTLQEPIEIIKKPEKNYPKFPKQKTIKKYRNNYTYEKNNRFNRKSHRRF